MTLTSAGCRGLGRVLAEPGSLSHQPPRERHLPTHEGVVLVDLAALERQQLLVRNLRGDNVRSEGGEMRFKTWSQEIFQACLHQPSQRGLTGYIIIKWYIPSREDA